VYDDHEWVRMNEEDPYDVDVSFVVSFTLINPTFSAR